MSVNTSRRSALWERPELPSSREATNAPIAPQLAAFRRHRKALLANLRKAYEGGPQSVPFDAEKSWLLLNRYAEFYFWREVEKQETLPAAARAQRLSELATALGPARALLEKAMQDCVGGDLFVKLCAERGITADTFHPTKQEELVRIADEIRRAAENLAVLETAARKAADAVHPKRKRPKGTSVLPADYIIALARVYRQTTGRRPSRVEGPFARFVREFLTATGQGGKLSNEYVVEIIKDARAQTRKNPGMWASSPFNS